MIKDRKTVISFTAEPELVKYLNQMAEKDHTTISQYIRSVLWCGYECDKAKDDEVVVAEPIDISKLKF